MKAVSDTCNFLGSGMFMPKMPPIMETAAKMVATPAPQQTAPLERNSQPADRVATGRHAIVLLSVAGWPSFRQADKDFRPAAGAVNAGGRCQVSLQGGAMLLPGKTGAGASPRRAHAGGARRS